MAKKVILILVEGNDEQLILEPVVKKLQNEIDKNKRSVKIEFQSDSMWTEDIVNPMNKINSFIRRLEARGNIKSSGQIIGVLKLIDVDGTWIPEKDIIVKNDKPEFEFDVSNKKVLFNSVAKKRNMVKKWENKKKKFLYVNDGEFNIKIKGKEIPVFLFINNISLEHIFLGSVVRSDGSQKIRNSYNINQQIEKMLESEGIDEVIKFFKEKTGDVSTNIDVFKAANKNPWDAISGMYFMILKLQELLQSYSEVSG